MQETDLSNQMIDLTQLVTVANQAYIGPYLEEAESVPTYELSCLYWIYGSMGDAVWDPAIMANVEQHLISNINKEIAI